jgi:hypothetical protein
VLATGERTFSHDWVGGVREGVSKARAAADCGFSWCSVPCVAAPSVRNVNDKVYSVHDTLKSDEAGGSCS